MQNPDKKYLQTKTTATPRHPFLKAPNRTVLSLSFPVFLSLDAFAIAGQSLVAYFIGAGRGADARKVAARVCQWSAALGLLLAVAMFWGRPLVAMALVPATALDVFATAWLTAAVIQPISALSFATDGIHWGTGDFGFLRNVVALATLTGVTALTLLDTFQPGRALTGIWAATGMWVGVRALFGMLRAWPGIGKSPLRAGGPEGR